jgi:hypothetical protein
VMAMLVNVLDPEAISVKLQWASVFNLNNCCIEALDLWLQIRDLPSYCPWPVP